MRISKFLVSFIQSSGYSPCEIYLPLKSYSAVKNDRRDTITRTIYQSLFYIVTSVVILSSHFVLFFFVCSSEPFIVSFSLLKEFGIKVEEVS